jgi:endonuclease YncB( thermonuclease family)
VVIVLDVTNWSTRSAELNPRDIRVHAAGATKPLRIAPGSTKALTKRLGTVELTDDLSVMLESEDSARIVLVYSTAPGGKDHALLVNESPVPVADRFVVDLAETDLPPIAVPAETVSAEIVSASDGKTMRVQLKGESKSQRIQLLGVEPPADGECFAGEAESTLDELSGTTVLIEEDAAITGGRTPQRYVWLVNVDGTRTLLNQALIAEGKAAAGEAPGDARFGLWLELTGIAAKDAGVGMWGGCATPELASPVPSGKATPSAP